MSITLGEATKLLDNMMINYSEWHTERAPQGKKVNSVEETSSLSDKIDVIMSMLVNDRTNIDPNNVPLASLVAQEEHVDVNFIKNNNFNNNAYRNNSSNNYRPYPYNNGNGYGNSYGNSYNNNRNSPPGLEAMLKEFISTQTAFNKSVEEKLGKIDILASKVDSLAADVDLLKSKVMPNENHHNKIVTTANAIQVRINENIRLMAELRARWDREENEKLAKEKNIAKVWTITTTSNANATHVAAPPTNNNKRIGVSNVSTSNAKREKLPETAKTAETACDKTAEIFSNIGDDDPIALDYNGLNFDDCHISEVIKFLQKLAKSPNASAINLAFTQHITNALIKAREEKLEREASIPKKLEDGWEPIIKMKVKDFDCNALCDLGASISVMPKKIYNMLDLPPLKNCYLDVNLADHSTKKPLGKVDNVRITVNNNLVPVDFVVLDIECNASCPIILGRPFLRTVGAIIDMKEGQHKDYLDACSEGSFTSKEVEARWDLLDRIEDNAEGWENDKGYADKPPFKPLPPKEGNEEKEEKKKKKKGTKKKKKKENKKKEVTAYPRVNEITLGNRKYVAPNDYCDNESEYDDLPMPFTYISNHDLNEHTTFDIANLWETNSENDDNNCHSVSAIHASSHNNIESCKLGEEVFENPFATDHYVFDTSPSNNNDVPIDETPERLQGRRHRRETPIRGTELSVRHAGTGNCPGAISTAVFTAIFTAIAVSMMRRE
ncbi:hypothetical protein QYE76_068722 [Lolium multiflorum]|uniref:Reverse transcriptase domain-containing protein n=1 Tax=Lolium multiflorum TaxID=4521 RepID=A0AAD8SEZ5_LOLMU|nr:hypothetical protein QYE76_068722 [Lolium multiflorum]